MRELRGVAVSGRLLVALVLLAALAGAGVLVAADGSSDAVSEPESDGATTTTAEEVDEAEVGATTTTTATTATTTAASESPDATRTDADSGYALDVRSIDSCGSACRDVTAALINEGSAARRNVTATTKVYADGDLLWSGDESVGTLSAGESHVSTKRVRVGFSGGMKIRANDGYVTIVTVVRSNSGTTELSERRKVA